MLIQGLIPQTQPAFEVFFYQSQGRMLGEWASTITGFPQQYGFPKPIHLPQVFWPSVLNNPVENGTNPLILPHFSIKGIHQQLDILMGFNFLAHLGSVFVYPVKAKLLKYNKRQKTLLIGAPLRSLIFVLSISRFYEIPALPPSSVLVILLVFFPLPKTASIP